MYVKYPSKYLQKAVEELANLPGIGRKTALRLALFILNKPDDQAKSFITSLINLKENVILCEKCHNISDSSICDICANPTRDKSTICVVRTISDVISIENTAQYHGLYHVLGGVISPLDGIGPGDLYIEDLCDRIENENIKEIILALGSTMEGDTTNFYIYKKLQNRPVKISVLSRGIPLGDEIEYTDELTLGHSILDRTAYESKLKL